ncbi:MAG: hypothetical protein KKD21_04845 [Proteobacteria bacterium]|nr:hypothetical protein [Pseudomonadota bacterium]MBU1696359.1 hypothetical protein [Pseudomonadota bacterium]
MKPRDKSAFAEFGSAAIFGKWYWKDVRARPNLQPGITVNGSEVSYPLKNLFHRTVSVHRVTGRCASQRCG